MVIRNYKELCTILVIPEKIANSKKAQLKNLRRYVQYENDGQKFIIKEIYEKPLDKVDNRDKGNNSIYLVPFEFILLNYLSNRRKSNGKFEMVELTTNQILKVTSMVNPHYAEKDFESYILRSDPTLNRADIDEFYRNARPRFYGNVKTMMKNLEGRCVLYVKYGHKIKVYGEWETATDKDEEMILKVKKQVLNELGFKKVEHVYQAGQQFLFFKNVNDAIIKNYGCFGWSKIYQIYSFGFSDTLDKNIEQYQKEIEEIVRLKIYLNETVKQRFDKSLEDYYAKHSGEKPELDYDKLKDEVIDDDEEEDKATSFILPINYLTKQKKLSNLLISIEKII
jgi:hypothetical protein